MPRSVSPPIRRVAAHLLCSHRVRAAHIDPDGWPENGSNDRCGILRQAPRPDRNFERLRRSVESCRRLANSDISERQACRYLGAARRMIRYVCLPMGDGTLRARLEELAAERRRFGFRRLAVLLRREGMVVNINGVLRICPEANLQVRKRARRRVARGRGTPAPLVSRLNQR